MIWTQALIFHGQQSGLQHMYCLGMIGHPRISIWKQHFKGEGRSGHQGKGRRVVIRLLQDYLIVDGCSSLCLLWLLIASVLGALLINIDTEREQIYWNIPQFLSIGIIPCPFWLGFPSQSQGVMSLVNNLDEWWHLAAQVTLTLSKSKVISPDSTTLTQAGSDRARGNSFKVRGL